MPAQVTFQIPFDTATVALTDLQARLHPHTIATRIAPKLARKWKTHLAAMPRKAHSDWPSSGFWESAARSVTGVAVGGNAVVTADRLGIRQRYFGGEIKARNVKNITIPVCAEAYGTQAKDWGDNLVLVILADGRKFLALWLGSEAAQSAYRKNLGKLTHRAEATAAKAARFRATVPGDAKKPDVIVFRAKGSGAAAVVARAERHMNLKFLFVLKPSVEQAGNPNVIPPDMAEFAQQCVLEATKAE